jgi:acylphosphatase|tara:strand:+ start:55 stop:324 length:270 start_codon:yes stop_codon:yes gene_type:complete
MQASHISVYGEVHNIGFRTWAKELAVKLDLSGWVRKASDGSIEILIQGEEDPITNFLSLCWDGPKMAYVDDVLATESSSDSTLIEFKVL